MAKSEWDQEHHKIWEVKLGSIGPPVLVSKFIELHNMSTQNSARRIIDTNVEIRCCRCNSRLKPIIDSSIQMVSLSKLETAPIDDCPTCLPNQKAILESECVYFDIKHKTAKSIKRLLTHSSIKMHLEATTNSSRKSELQLINSLNRSVHFYIIYNLDWKQVNEIERSKNDQKVDHVFLILTKQCHNFIELIEALHPYGKLLVATVDNQQLTFNPIQKTGSKVIPVQVTNDAYDLNNTISQWLSESGRDDTTSTGQHRLSVANAIRTFNQKYKAIIKSFDLTKSWAQLSLVSMSIEDTKYSENTKLIRNRKFIRIRLEKMQNLLGLTRSTIECDFKSTTSKHIENIENLAEVKRVIDDEFASCDAMWINQSSVDNIRQSIINMESTSGSKQHFDIDTYLKKREMSLQKAYIENNHGWLYESWNDSAVSPKKLTDIAALINKCQFESEGERSSCRYARSAFSIFEESITQAIDLAAGLNGRFSAKQARDIRKLVSIVDCMQAVQLFAMSESQALIIDFVRSRVTSYY